MRGHRNRLAGPLLIAAGLLVAPVPSAAAPPPAKGLVVVRTGPGPAVLDGRMTARAGSSESTVVMFALSGTGARRTLDGAFSTTRVDWGVDGCLHRYGPDGGQPPDLPPAVCADVVGTPVAGYFHSNGRPIASVVYLAGWHVTDLSATVSSPGWRVEPWTPDMRVVRVDDAGGEGYRVLGTNEGTFARAEAPGGRHGSFAWARLPCDESGTGRAEFTGGSRPYLLDCGGTTGRSAAVPGPTRWRLVGHASGRSSVINVLVVVDYPR